MLPVCRTALIASVIFWLPLAFIDILAPTVNGIIELDKAVKRDGFLYLADVTPQSFQGLLPIIYELSGDDKGARSGLILKDEQGKPFPHPHQAHADIAKLGGGRYSHWQNYIFFSLPNDVPQDGRVQLFWQAKLVPHLWVTLGFHALTVALLCSLACYSLNKWPSQVKKFLPIPTRATLGDGTSHEHKRRTKLLIFGFVASMSLARALLYPYTFNSIDSACLLGAVGEPLTQVPHYAPLLPLFATLATHLTQSPYALVIIQAIHLALFSLAVTYLALTARTYRGQFITSLAMFMIPALPLLAGGFYNESITVSGAILVAGSVWRILSRGFYVNHWLMFALGVVLLAGSRHLAEFLAISLPASVFILSPFRISPPGLEDSTPVNLAKTLMPLAAGFLAVLYLSHMITLISAREYKSISGLAGIEVVGQTMARLPEAERKQLYSSLLDSFRDESSAMAVLSGLENLFTTHPDRKIGYDWYTIKKSADQYYSSSNGTELTEKEYLEITFSIYKRFAISQVKTYLSVIMQVLKSYLTFTDKFNTNDISIIKKGNNDFFSNLKASNDTFNKIIGPSIPRHQESEAIWSFLPRTLNISICFVVGVVLSCLLAIKLYFRKSDAEEVVLLALLLGSLIATLSYYALTSAAIALWKLSYQLPGSALMWSVDMIVLVTYFEMVFTKSTRLSCSGTR